MIIKLLHLTEAISCYIKDSYFLDTINMCDRGRTNKRMQIPLHNRVWYKCRRLQN